MARIATTIEESKRLLELGIDPKSADMFWSTSEMDEFYEKEHPKLLVGKPPVVVFSHLTFIPAWSLGALLEVVWKVGPKAIIMSFHYNNQPDFIADLVEFIDRLVNGCFKGKEE